MNSLNEFYYFCNRILKMKIPQLHSLKTIERKYNTGEEPVLVVCSDLNSYICKYMRSSSAAYKLVCELIARCQHEERILENANKLKDKYEKYIGDSIPVVNQIVAEIPEEWHVSQETIEAKLSQLFDKDWIDGAWNNFMECLNENVNYE